MQKIYLLLRNNRQIGPHTLEELVKLGLKSHDLVWVEGKSNSWLYPTEIEALKPYIQDAAGTVAPNLHPPAKAPETKPQENKENKPQENKATPKAQQPAPQKNEPPKSIFVSLPHPPAAQPTAPAEPTPAEKLEQKAEALRQRAQSFTPEPKTPETKKAPEPTEHKDEALQTHYTRSLDEIEETYTSWVYQQKTARKKHSPAKNWVVAALLAVVVAAGYLLLKDDTQNDKNVADIKPKENLEQETITAPASETEAVYDEKQDSGGAQSGARPPAVLSLAKTPASSPKKDTPITTPSDSSNPAAPLTAGTGNNQPQPLAADSNQAAVTSINGGVASADPAGKKKTLGEKIDGFFERFKSKKTEETPSNETAKTTPDAGSGERKATQREDNAAPNQVTTVNLTPYVDVTTSQPTENWMMGVKGLKITLKNHSNETVKTAAVEVRYYDEQDALLEKKLVYFNNVPPKKSLTLPAPDHRLADHTDYQLLSAIGTEEGYVRQ